MSRFPDWGYAAVVAVSAGATCLAYAVRAMRLGTARYDRVDKVGGSLLLSKRLVEMGYWGAQPIARSCRAIGLTPNTITWLSLAFGAGAGVALGCGDFGLAALFAVVSAIADILDGLVARQLGVASNAGEVLDAAVDRYTEFFLLAGAVVLYRAHVVLQAIALAALCGSFMISYSTAKAEALGVEPPKGAMRRHERAFYLIAGCALTPLLSGVIETPPRFPAVIGVPLVVSLVVVAVVGNVSAVRRFIAVFRSVRARELAARTARKEAVALGPAPSVSAPSVSAPSLPAPSLDGAE